MRPRVQPNRQTRAFRLAVSTERADYRRILSFAYVDAAGSRNPRAFLALGRLRARSPQKRGSERRANGPGFLDAVRNQNASCAAVRKRLSDSERFSYRAEVSKKRDERPIRADLAVGGRPTLLGEARAAMVLPRKGDRPSPRSVGQRTLPRWSSRQTCGSPPPSLRRPPARGRVAGCHRPGGLL